MKDKRLIVQFIHPGSEHRPDRWGLKEWNAAKYHKRKFLTSEGSFIDARGHSHRDRLVFWGEWEPQSRAIACFASDSPGMPRYLFEPYYAVPSSYRGLQNTDPFVFGDRFHYTGCLQHSEGGVTQLRFLKKGSLLLMGSCINNRAHFGIDTVFVIAEYIDHHIGDYEKVLGEVVSDTYWDVTIRPWYENLSDLERSHRLYFGATPEDPVDGMFSFFPCLPLEAEPRRFPRPQIQLSGIVNPRLCQNRKHTLVPPGNAKQTWDEVVRQVREQGRLLGARADLPPKIDDASAAVSPRTRQAGL